MWRTLHCNIDRVWHDDEAEPQSKDDQVHDKEPAEVDKIRDDCSAKVTFDLFHVAVPEPVVQCNSQARFDLGPFLQYKREKKMNKNYLTLNIYKAEIHTPTHKHIIIVTARNTL